MRLHYKKYGEKGPVLIILHGLFGMSDNWHSLAVKWSANRTIYNLDLRNHGQSPHSHVMNYDIMADDILEFMVDHGILKASIMGHSMGGKCAMAFADKYPTKVEKLIVVDIAPRHYKPGHDLYFKALKSLDLTVENRKMVEEQLATSVKDKGELLFLLKNLYRDAHGRFSLKINLEALERNYNYITGEVPFRAEITVPAMFIRGGRSGYIQDDDWTHISDRFRQATCMTIPDAGHWVHADQPEAVFQAVNQFLNTAVS